MQSRWYTSVFKSFTLISRWFPVPVISTFPPWSSGETAPFFLHSCVFNGVLIFFCDRQSSKPTCRGVEAVIKQGSVPVSVQRFKAAHSLYHQACCKVILLLLKRLSVYVFLTLDPWSHYLAFIFTKKERWPCHHCSYLVIGAFIYHQFTFNEVYRFITMWNSSVTKKCVVWLKTNFFYLLHLLQTGD